MMALCDTKNFDKKTAVRYHLSVTQKRANEK